MGVVSPQLYTDPVILEAELTVGMPSKVTALTGIDAMVHAIEAYTTRLKKNPPSDMLALQALPCCPGIWYGCVKTVTIEPRVRPCCWARCWQDRHFLIR